MTPEDQQAFEAKIQSFVGREVCPPTPAEDNVSRAMIRHWAEIMGDANPAYLDEKWAADSNRGRTISPPAMMYVWNQEGYAVTTQRAPDALSDLVQTFTDSGFTGVLGTNVKQEYFKEISVGDHVTMTMVIDSVSERKTTARGIGYFLETLAIFTDQHGDKIGIQSFRVFKFIPPAGTTEVKPEGPAKLEVPTRINSPRGHDNKWWWEACDDGRVLIQRCSECQTLRHPPRPMCGECQSMGWDSIESTLIGEVLSYTQIHHPRIPGYQYPLVCAVIKLEEGTNLISNIVGCDPEQISIGMNVKGRVERIDEKTVLPQFYPADHEFS